MVDCTADILMTSTMDLVLMERLAAYSTPSRLPVEGYLKREQRSWVVRLVRDLPQNWMAEQASDRLSKEAEIAVVTARTMRGLSATVDVIPSVRVVVMDERHVIVIVSTVKLEEDDAHDYLVAASGALVALDVELPLDDIQGIPRRFWRVLIGEAQSSI
jgi:hypothetical protein